jgi:hypothetical protein
MSRVTRFATVLAAGLVATPAFADVRQVPSAEYPTIQAAAETASDGTTIEVGTGRWCGAVIRSRVTIVGKGDAVIVGGLGNQSCQPVVAVERQLVRVGLYLAPGASGTRIKHMRFEGGSAADALVVGVYADPTVKVNDVVIEQNKMTGLAQAVHNPGGDRWSMQHNRVRGLAPRSGLTPAAFVLTQTGSLRPSRNSFAHNRVRAAVPDSLDGGRRWVSGVVVAGAVDTDLEHNRFRFESTEGQTIKGVGVHVTKAADQPGGKPPCPKCKPTPGVPGAASEHTAAVRNLAGSHAYVVVVDIPDSGRPNDLVLRDNRKVSLVRGVEVTEGGRHDGRHDDRDDDDRDDDDREDVARND